MQATIRRHGVVDGECANNTKSTIEKNTADTDAEEEDDDAEDVEEDDNNTNKKTKTHTKKNRR